MTQSPLDLPKSTRSSLTLLDQLRHVRVQNEPVLLVTFNYDRMIEAALSSIELSIGELHHYVQSNTFKLFKLHGSVNWAREVENQIANISECNDWQVANELIKVSPSLKLTDRFRIVDSHPIGKAGDIPLFPAIALPVETKLDFECPPNHLDCLCAHLGKVTKVLTVGWAAQEYHFLKILKDRLPQEIYIHAVASGKQDAESVLGRIKAAGICIKEGVPVTGGFTEYAVSRQLERSFGA